jgi:hypothetical protein
MLCSGVRLWPLSESRTSSALPVDTMSMRGLLERLRQRLGQVRVAAMAPKPVAERPRGGANVFEACADILHQRGIGTGAELDT